MTGYGTVAVTGWLAGIARCLDLGGVFDGPGEIIHDDVAAVWSDWEKVGDDFRSVLR